MSESPSAHRHESTARTHPAAEPSTAIRHQMTDDGTITGVGAPKPRTPLQFVSPDGKLTEQGRAHGVDLELARTLYRDMFLARRLDAEALALQRQGELGLWLMCLGQEAAQVGSIRALRQDDYVFPSYREHAAALARGIRPAEMLSQWRGVSHGGWNPRTYNFHIYSLVLGTHTLHATGYAIGAAHEQSDEVVMTYFGDGASSQGDVNEALNWAATAMAPLIFFCQNNHWAISTPATLQSRGALHQRAAGFGLYSYLVDGNDALAVHAVTTAAAKRVREGNGPAFIEAETYRMAGHSSSDDPGRYRDEGEVDLWRQRDPLSRLKALLEAPDTGGSDADDSDTIAAYFERLDDEAETLAREIREACRALTDPNLLELFDKVYAEPHQALDLQAREYDDYVHSFEETPPTGLGVSA